MYVCISRPDGNDKMMKRVLYKEEKVIIRSRRCPQKKSKKTLIEDQKFFT